MVTLVNRAKVSTATTGTGTITLGAAESGYQTFADAGVADTNVVRYVIEDGDAWEIGTGTYTATGTTLTRTVSESSNADAAISLTGSAVVYVSAAGADIVQPSDLATVATTGAYTDLSGLPTLYTDAAVDTHLNTGTALTGEVLSWTGADYDWVAVSGGATDIDGLSDGYSDGSSVGLGSGALAADDGSTNRNTALGINAANTITSGQRNAVFGYNALVNGTTASYSTIIGTEAAGGTSFVTTGGYNTAIGAQAGYELTTGAENTFIGYLAGYNTATGSNNIGIGAWALSTASAALSGTYNTAIGSYAGQDLSTGTHNFLGGYQAGTNLTAGSNNVAIGNGALDAATTGSSNVAIGLSAGGSISTATRTIFIGEAAGSNASNGMGIGYRAARYSTAESNLAFGNEALSDTLLTGANNLAFGRQALLNTENGSQNCAFGNQSGQGIRAGSDNTLFGYIAGFSVSSGTQNTIVGSQAGATFGGSDITTGSNNTLVGYQASASSATVSNEITLGNSSVTRFRIPAAGIDNTSAALSGTTPSVDTGARDTYTLSTTGNTTFTFTGAPSSGQVGTFSLIVTAGGTHTLTWPASVDWAGGAAPDAPASGEKDIYTFMTVDGGTTWYGFLAGDAMA